MIGGGTNDAEQGNWRAALDFIEDQMRGIGRHAGKIRAGSHQRLNTISKIASEIVEFSGIQHGNAFIYVEAVDDDVRISAIRLASAKARKDGAVIVDGGFRPEPADDSQGAHGNQEMLGGKCRIHFSTHERFIYAAECTSTLSRAKSCQFHFRRH